MNTAVAMKSKVKVVKNQPPKEVPVPKRIRGAKKTPWGPIAFFIIFIAVLALLYSPNTPPKSGGNASQAEYPLNGFGNKLIGK